MLPKLWLRPALQPRCLPGMRPSHRAGRKKENKLNSTVIVESTSSPHSHPRDTPILPTTTYQTENYQLRRPCIRALSADNTRSETDGHEAHHKHAHGGAIMATRPS